jgi:hypothetical protein
MYCATAKMKIEISKRWNKFGLGFALGVLLPALFFLGIYLYAYPKIPFLNFIKFSMMSQILPKILSLCVAPNLALFYFFLNKEFWYATRGVIAA